MKKIVPPSPGGPDHDKFEAGASTDSRPSVPLQSTPLRTRARAAAIHFLLSLLVVVVCAFALLLRWYPGDWLYAAGGIKLLLMIAGVDLVLGPLLTMVVFDRRKKSLPFDLAFIAVLQLCALGYGLHVAYQGRPVFSVFVIDRFELLSAADVDATEHKRVRPEFAALSASGPVLAVFEKPVDTQDANELALAAAAGVDARYFLRYFVPIEPHWPAVLAASRPVAELAGFNDAARIEQVLQGLQSLQGAAADRTAWRYLPVQTRHEDLTMIVDPASGRSLATVRLAPWHSK